MGLAFFFLGLMGLAVLVFGASLILWLVTRKKDDAGIYGKVAFISFIVLVLLLLLVLL